MTYDSATCPTHEATAKRENISVSLTSHLVAFLEACVDSGRYQSTSEVVREALRFLEETHALHRAEIQRAHALMVGLDQEERGQAIDCDQIVEDGWDTEYGGFGRRAPR